MSIAASASTSVLFVPDPEAGATMNITERTPFRDLVLMPDLRAFAENQPADETHPFPGHVDLGFDLEITPIDRTLCEAIVRACTPPGENCEVAVDLREWLYAVVRYDAPREPFNRWDGDERLQTAIALSRLVQPTSLSFRYAARIVGNPLDPPRMIIPGPVRGFGSSAWVTDPTGDWLTNAHADELRVLLEAYFGKDLSSRPRRALWYHEYAARSYELDVRWTFVATALEALLNTNPRNGTEQFVQRVQQLAMRVGEPAVSKTRANDMYGYRSKLVHGQQFDGGAPKMRTVYSQMESLLSAAIRGCILDSALEALFEDEGSIDAAFPLSLKEQ